MKKISLIKVALMASLLMGLVWGAYSVTLVKAIKSTPAGIYAYDIEDMQMCADGKTAVMVAVARNDDARVYWYDLINDKVSAFCRVGILYGPRGDRGIGINPQCTYAYLANYPLDSVSTIDLAASPKDTPKPSGGKYCVMTETAVAPKPNGDIGLNYPEWHNVMVASSFSDVITILDAQGKVIEEIEMGFGPDGVLALGKEWAVVPNRYDDTLYVIDLPRLEVYTTVTGLHRVPDTACLDPAGYYVYGINFVDNSVDVIRTGSWNVVKTIPVGQSPRYCAMSPDGKFLYVSNTTDKTVSVIDTASKKVVETIVAAGPTEPAAIKWLAVTNDNRYLYVYYPGGRSGTYADFTILKFDVGQLYGG
jgi:YVTN family beta-propeller protein